MDITNPHDRFFKETFSVQENARDFFAGTFPPEILQHLDLSTLTLDNSSYIDEELKGHFSDMVYNCNCGDNELKIAILFEHKSFPPVYPHLQILKYLLKIWQLNIKQGRDLMPVIPVILYHGRERWRVKGFADCFKGIKEPFYRFIPGFEYLLTDLSGYSNEDIKNRIFRRVSLEIAMLLMKNIFDEKELGKNLKDFLEIGRKYIEHEEGLKFLEGVIRYLFKAEIEPETVFNTIKDISEKGGELVMTMEAKLIEKGERKGMEKGRVEGLKEAIALGLELKYGVKGLELFGKIVNISSLEKLKAVKEAVKTSKNMEEIESLI